MFKVVSRRLSRQTLRNVLGVLSVVSGIYLLYIWRLGTLTPGLSLSESAARQLSSKLGYISDNPINAPLRLLQYLAQNLGHHGAFYMRFASVVFMMIFVICLYLLLKTWFGRLIGFFGTLLMIGTPWFILMARSATGTVMLLAPLAIIASFLWLTSSKKQPRLAWVTLVCVCAISLYIPGLVWFTLAAGLMRRRELLANLKQNGPIVISLSAILAIAIIVPLVLAISRDLSIVKQLLLIPNHWQGVIGSLKSIAWSVLALFWHTPYHIDMIIGRLHLLSITQVALAAIGVYAMWINARKETYSLLAILAASIIFSGLNANLELLTLAILAVCIFATAGLRYLYVEWRGVFPRNPIPKVLALSLIGLVIGVHLMLGVRYSLIAWPHTTATHSLYVIK
ncbi:glycosyltransferase family 39 protein [Candidatus Saccharibacteria bacterium]|nr:glycosyltransferase family 39 protein [Candidatus Saccharibacteria bacterium]